MHFVTSISPLSSFLSRRAAPRAGTTPHPYLSFCQDSRGHTSCSGEKETSSSPVASGSAWLLATSRRLAAPLHATRALLFFPPSSRADEIERATLRRFHLRGSKSGIPLPWSFWDYFLGAFLSWESRFLIWIGLTWWQAGDAPSSSGREADMSRRRSPEPLDFFIWTVEVPSRPSFRNYMFIRLKSGVLFCSPAIVRYLVHLSSL